jgi:hypothetical protein
LSTLASAGSSLPAIAGHVQPQPRAGRKSSSWTIVVFALVTLGLLYSPLSGALLYAFPLMAFLLAAYLYRHDLSAFVTLACWLWFITPLLRRLVDYHIGYGRPAAILLAPPLALCAPAVWLIADWRKVLRPPQTAPMFCFVITCLYATFHGILNMAPRLVFQDLLTWVSPVIFAFTLIHHRDQAEEMFQAFEKAFVYGLLMVSIYGIYQFYVMPEWDANWMTQVDMNSIGNPKPTEVRVFSSMNAPQIVASFLAVGLIAAFNSRYKIRFVAIPAGLLCLALSLARSGWVAATAGILYLLWKLPQRQRFQLVVAGLVATVALIFALQTNDDLQQVLSARFESLSDVKNDDSANERVEAYTALFGGLLTNPFGLGMGATVAVEENKVTVHHGWNQDLGDSTVAMVVTTMGLAGGLVIAWSLFPLGRRMFREPSVKPVYTHTMQAVFIAMMAEAALDGVISTPTGFLTWGSIGFCLALAIAHDDGRREAVSATA